MKTKARAGAHHPAMRAMMRAGKVRTPTIQSTAIQNT
jgi:hypothetical protein